MSFKPLLRRPGEGGEDEGVGTREAHGQASGGEARGRGEAGRGAGPQEPAGLENRPPGGVHQTDRPRSLRRRRGLLPLLGPLPLTGPPPTLIFSAVD